MSSMQPTCSGGWVSLDTGWSLPVGFSAQECSQSCNMWVHTYLLSACGICSAGTRWLLKSVDIRWRSGSPANVGYLMENMAWAMWSTLQGHQSTYHQLACPRSEPESVNLLCKSSGWSHMPIGDVCIGASQAGYFHRPHPKAKQGRSPLTSVVVFSDWGGCTSNTLEFVYASKASQKSLYKQTDCPLSVGNVLLLADELKLLLWTNILLVRGALEGLVWVTQTSSVW